MDTVEKRRFSLTKSAAQNIPSSANAAAALKRALKDYGLLKGVLATDIQELKNVVETVAPETKIQSAGTALSRIRPVKSAAEIALMKQSGWGRDSGRQAIDNYIEEKTVCAFV